MATQCSDSHSITLTSIQGEVRRRAKRAKQECPTKQGIYNIMILFLILSTYSCMQTPSCVHFLIAKYMAVFGCYLG